MALADPQTLTRDLNALLDTSDASALVHGTIEALATPHVPGLGGATDPALLTPYDVAGFLDHTQLRPEATRADVAALINEAREHAFIAVCIAPTYVEQAREALQDTQVTVCTVIGFPHGNSMTSVKTAEVRQAVADGARELDMVINIGAMKDGRHQQVYEDVERVVDAARTSADAIQEDVHVKVILETALLTPAEIALAAFLSARAGANFVKTSTGFAGGGATVEDVALMRQVVPDDVGVKASGGVGSLDDLRAMIGHGATRIGASGSVGIIEEAYAAADDPDDSRIRS